MNQAATLIDLNSSEGGPPRAAFDRRWRLVQLERLAPPPLPPLHVAAHASPRARTHRRRGELRARRLVRDRGGEIRVAVQLHGVLLRIRNSHPAQPAAVRA